MRVSQLGVVIDSSGAKRGSQESTAALASIAQQATKTGQEVTKATKAVSQSMDEQVRAHQRAQAQANRAANDARRQAAEALEQANARRAHAAAAEQAAQRIAAAEDKKTRAMALAEAQAYKMDAALEQAGKGALGTEAGMNRLRGSLTATLAPLLGTVGAGNTLASTLLSLGPGNTVAVAVVGGMAVMGAAIEIFRSQTAEARKETEEARKALQELQKQQRQGATGDLPGQINTALREQLRLKRDLADAERNLQQLQNSPSYAGAKTGVSGADEQAAALRRAAAEVTRIQGEIAAGQRKANEVIRDTERNASAAAAASLIALVRSNQAKAADNAALLNRLKNYQQDLARLEAANADAVDRARLVEKIDAIKAAYESRAKAVAKSSDEEVKWQNYVRDIFADVQRVVDKSEAAQREASEKRNKSITDGVSAIDAQIAARARENDRIRENIKELNGESNAYDSLTEAQWESKAVAEALAKLPPGVLLDPETETNIRSQVREWYNLNNALKDAKKVRAALNSEFNANRDGLFTLPPGAAEAAKKFTQELYDGLRDALAVMTQIADLARSGNGGQALIAGATGALNLMGPQGRAAAQAVQLADALDLFGIHQAERNRQLRELANQFNAALDDFAIAPRTNLQDSLRQNISRATGLAQQAASASGVTATGLSFSGSADISKLANDLSALPKAARAGLEPFIDKLRELAAVTKANEEAIRARNAAELETLTADLAVRRLVAAGNQDAADAERQRLAQLKEIRDAEEKFGAESPYIAALREVQASELAAAEAARQLAEAERIRQQAQQANAFGLDVTARRQTLNGDDRGAFITRQQIGQNSALTQAEDLAKAGIITAEALAEFKRLLGDEFAKSISDFDAAVAKANRQVQEDLSVRELVAKGMSREAEQVRQAIADRRELEGVTDENIRQIILNVQALEAEARQRAELAALQQQIAEQNADIDRRMLDALKALDPVKAAELQDKLTEAERAKELAAAADDMVRARYQELYAMQDAAAAQAKLTDELNRQREAAQALANFSSSVEVDYLRATGRTFDADALQLKQDREQRLKDAAGVGADQDTIDKINAIFEAKYSALIAATMQAAPTASPVSAAAGGRFDAGITLGEDTTAFRSSQSITESSAMRMIDYAAAQTTLLRRLVQLAEGGQQTSDAGRVLAALTYATDRTLGVLASDSQRLVNGSIA